MEGDISLIRLKRYGSLFKLTFYYYYVYSHCFVLKVSAPSLLSKFENYGYVYNKWSLKRIYFYLVLHSLGGTQGVLYKRVHIVNLEQLRVSSNFTGQFGVLFIIQLCKLKE